jgi:DNA modification methylase
METITINSRIIKTELIKWRDLEFIQQENFKEWINDGDTKLIESILKYQFCDAFKVWEHDGKLYCLDGKHRFLDLIKVSELGHNVPDELPATFVECENIESAAELVLIYSSNYAKITQQGLFDFVSKFNLDVPSLNAVINIPEFSMQRFEQKFDLFQVETGEEPHVESNPFTNVVKIGDLFQLNGHRILCGSFKNPEEVQRLMYWHGNAPQTEKARIVNCDPPYNLPANFFTNKDEQRHKDFAMGAGEMTDEEFVQFLALIMTTSVANSVPGAIHYIFMDFRHSWHMTEAARRVYGNPQPKQICVWHKDMMANGAFYRAQHELCFIFSDEKAKALWQKDLLDEGGEFYKDNNEWCFIFKNGEAAKHLSHLELKNRIRSNVWKYPSATSMANPDRFELKNHPTPKPVVMIADSILDTTNENDIVIDWFLGSGTCLIACEHTNRRGRFTEIEPMYVQSAIIRYINYCNKRKIDVTFTHLNGNLTLKDFANESKL